MPLFIVSGNRCVLNSFQETMCGHALWVPHQRLITNHWLYTTAGRAPHPSYLFFGRKEDPAIYSGQHFVDTSSVEAEHTMKGQILQA